MSQSHEYSRQVKPATRYTEDKNKNFAKALGLDISNNTTEELELAGKNLIYPAGELELKAPDGHVIWSLKPFSFYKEKAVPFTINPSLWLNGKGNYQAGVFEVVKGAIYQVRGFDIANLTIIRSKTGWIVQDVMSTVETSRAAIELLEKALNEPVSDRVRAVIISHSHADHFGGIRGVVSPEEVGHASEGKIPIYVPEGFDEETVKENVFAGNAMYRRSQYQFGADIGTSPTGLVSTGLGLASPKGTVSYIPPTEHISKNGPVVIDGITVDFQLTPNTEAPAEMNNYYADYRAFWVAENCTCTLHNLYPIRGAQLRDSEGWAGFILEAVELFADKSDVVFQSHNWPHFNTEENPDAVKDYLINSASIYKYIHDQTLLYANEGFTAKEAAKKVHIPKGLSLNWYTRPYYGSLPINARAVYTKYLGFFNGDPNDIDPLTEVEEAKTFVEYAGSEENVIKKAEDDFEKGDYRKAAFAAGKVVLADPSNEQARLLTADAFEQLGYVSESTVWRNAYLQGAYELRNGVDEKRPRLAHNDITKEMTSDQLLKYIAILTDYDASEDEEFSFDLTVTEDIIGKKVTTDYHVLMHAGVLLSWPAEKKTDKNYVKGDKELLVALVNHRLDSVKDKIDTNVYGLLETIEKNIVDISRYESFNMIEPRE